MKVTSDKVRQVNVGLAFARFNVLTELDFVEYLFNLHHIVTVHFTSPCHLAKCHQSNWHHNTAQPEYKYAFRFSLSPVHTERVKSNQMKSKIVSVHTERVAWRSVVIKFVWFSGALTRVMRRDAFGVNGALECYWWKDFISDSLSLIKSFHH